MSIQQPDKPSIRLQSDSAPGALGDGPEDIPAPAFYPLDPPIATGAAMDSRSEETIRC